MNSLIEKYKACVDNMYFGPSSETSIFLSELRKLNDENFIPDRELLRRLLCIRVQVCFNEGSDITNADRFLNDFFSENAFLKAETAFVLGLVSYYKKDFEKGVSYFKCAFLDYPNHESEKKLLCKYNIYIGQVNSDQLSSYEAEIQLDVLEAEFRREKCKKALALALRQKANLLEKKKSLLAASQTLSEAIDILKLTGTKADLQLAQLSQCRILFDLSKDIDSKTILESIRLPLEKRVEFPYKLTLALIYQQKLPDPKKFEFVNPYWISIYNSRKVATPLNENEQTQNYKYEWNQEFGDLLDLNLKTHFCLRRDSLEGQLLNLLICRPQSAIELQEQIWIDSSSKFQTQDRFNQLLARVRKKIPGLIKLKQGQYFLDSSQILIIR